MAQKNKENITIGIVIVPDKIPKKLLSSWIKNYGGLKVKKVPLKDDDLTRIAKYIVKLSSHALKKSTKGNRIIYSRSFQRSPNENNSTNF